MVRRIIVILTISVTVLNIGNIDRDIFGVLARLAGLISKLARAGVLAAPGEAVNALPFRTL